MLEPLNRTAAVSVMTDAVTWARALLEQTEAEHEPPQNAEGTQERATDTPEQ